MIKKIIIIIVLLVVAWVFIRFVIGGPEDDWICVDGRWVKHGHPTISMPTKACDGQFQNENVVVFLPKENQVIGSPFLVEGEARGTWFFEADFPVKLFDGNGELLAVAIAQAQGNWMTENFVPFKAELTFEQSVTKTGTLVLEKDNPSGLVEHADELRIPVLFTQETKTIKLYYYNPELDKDDSGNVMCSRKGLVAVEREIAASTTPIQGTIKLLLKGRITEKEKSQGIDTEYPLKDFSLESASLQDGILTLEFDDPNNKSVGGSCRVGILWFQIEATAKQFPEVKQVRFLPEEIFQP